MTIPGTDTHYEERDGRRTAWLLHPEGSWARATATGDQPPEIHQAGPRRLWDHLDGFRRQWLRDGSLPVYGAAVTITPDGSITLRRGKMDGNHPRRSLLSRMTFLTSIPAR